MKQSLEYSSRFRILKGGKIALIVSALLTSATLLHAAPSGGVVTSGSASINQSGSVTNINQSSQKASINWKAFSIAASETVNFNQPNKNSITLNRVVGNEKSVIEGALNANGQVWILNSNGVLFNSSAKINTSGLVATTKALSDEDFQKGEYSFKGDSSASVVNLGEITINNGGYAALLANTVQNEGTIKAIQGTVHLTGASEATINLNGNSLVNLKVDKGVLDALVENKGAILADGGKIYLTTNAANELLKGVVNNTGLLEANSLEDVTGEIILFAHGGEVKVGGVIQAEKGFVETSGKEFSIQEGTVVKAGEWLIDPVNILINSALASAIGTALNSADVTITTSGSNTPSTTSGESGSAGDIKVSSSITKTTGSKTKLTLAAERNILIDSGVVISGSNGSPLDIVLASRYLGGTYGSIALQGALKSYGGDITLGGGNLQASDYAVAYNGTTVYGNNWAGVYVWGNIDATGDGSGTANNTMPTATSGGNISIKGKGNTIASSQANWGIQFEHSGTVALVTGGTGSITLEGHGGASLAKFYNVASPGITMESANTYIKANKGDVILKGYAGTGYDKYGVLVQTGFIGTNGYLDVEGDSFLLRGGTLNVYVGGSGDIKAPIIGLYGATYGVSKLGSGILNLWGDTKNWHDHIPSGTTDTGTNGTFSDATNKLNLVNLTQGQALYAFSTVPATINIVSQSSATPLNSVPSTQAPSTVEVLPSSIAAITNGTAIQVPKIVSPTPTIVVPTIQAVRTLQNGQVVELSSTPLNDTKAELVSLQEVKKALSSTGSEDVRIPLGENSIIQVVNGGLSLPSGVEQELYVAQR